MKDAVSYQIHFDEAITWNIALGPLLWIEVIHNVIMFLLWREKYLL